MRRIHELLQKGDPSHVAITDHDGVDYTYADLSRLVEDMAARLSGYGIRPGDRVMLLSENSVTYLAATLALGRLDAWTLLANARLTAAEVDRLAQVADIRCTIYTPEVSSAARGHAARMGVFRWVGWIVANCWFHLCAMPCPNQLRKVRGKPRS
ncbi:AMP-binding protein [Paracoccus kondratievae]